MMCTYNCAGWQKRSAEIRARDGAQCRGCGRTGDEVALQVHHRRYGDHNGKCGECFLTGVSDEDLTTFCTDCHDAITNIRRTIRYATRTIEIGYVGSPPAAQAPIRVKAEVSIDLAVAPVRTAAAVRRIEEIPIQVTMATVAPVTVVRPRPFNPYGKE